MAFRRRASCCSISWRYGSQTVVAGCWLSVGGEIRWPKSVVTSPSPAQLVGRTAIPAGFREACLFLDVHPLLARCAAHSGEKSPSALMILFSALWLLHCFPTFAEKCKRCR